MLQGKKKSDGERFGDHFHIVSGPAPTKGLPSAKIQSKIVLMISFVYISLYMYIHICIFLHIINVLRWSHQGRGELEGIQNSLFLQSLKYLLCLQWIKLWKCWLETKINLTLRYQPSKQYTDLQYTIPKTVIGWYYATFQLIVITWFKRANSRCESGLLSLKEMCTLLAFCSTILYQSLKSTQNHSRMNWRWFFLPSFILIFSKIEKLCK